MLLLLLSFPVTAELQSATYVPGQEKGKRQEKVSSESALVGISPTESLGFLPFIYAVLAAHENSVFSIGKRLPVLTRNDEAANADFVK
jgi:hypothetical protein